MKSIQVKYSKIREELPWRYSSYICFAKTVKGQKYSRKMIGKWFDILVEKEDYVRKERNAIVSYLYELSNKVEEGEF
jgi:hypothetical protein